jgi:SAM-dependent methyltransferase
VNLGARQLSEVLRGVLSLRATRGLDLDSEESTLVHAELIRRKTFLHRIYEHYYREFVFEAESCPRGLRVEVGSGGGFLDHLLPGVIRTDIRHGARVDLLASADALPIRAGSVSCIFGLDVLHHMRSPLHFLKECARVLVQDGRLVLIEPFVSPCSRIIYRYLHHEDFRPDREEWGQDSAGVLSNADAALSWVVLVRDRHRLEHLVPDLVFEKLRPHTISLYLLSGGLTFPALAPAALYPWVARLENALPLEAHRLLGSMMTVVMRRGRPK